MVRDFATRKVVGRVALVAAVVLISGLLGVGAAAAFGRQEQSGWYQEHFPDGVRQFCSEFGYLSSGNATIGQESEGFESAEQAITAYENEIREGVEALIESTGKDLDQSERSRILELMAPSRNFKTTLRTPARDGGRIYADLPSEKQGVLEARLIVIPLDNGLWDVLADIRCESTIATNIDEVRAIMGVEDEEGGS